MRYQISGKHIDMSYETYINDLDILISFYLLSVKCALNCFGSPVLKSLYSNKNQ